MSAHGVGRLRVDELWRYPIKSLRGEQLSDVVITEDGVSGDRLVHVRGTRGLLTGRTRNALLTIPASTGPDGEPLVGGARWDTHAAATIIEAAAGDGTTLVRDDAPERFDVLPLLVATAVEPIRLGMDMRRLRPNLVIIGAHPGEEREWPGHALEIGGAVIGVHSLRARCVVTTIDPDTGTQDLNVLRRIRRDLDGAVALDCWVITGGKIHRGDPVAVVPLPDGAQEPRPGGWVTGAPYSGQRQTNSRYRSTRDIDHAGPQARSERQGATVPARSNLRDGSGTGSPPRAGLMPNEAPRDEFELLQRLRAGDEAAFSELVNRYHAAMVRLALTRVRTPAVAEEVAQEAWLGLLRGIDGFEGRSSLRTWLFRIVINRAINAGIKERVYLPVADDELAAANGRFSQNGGWVTPPTHWSDEVLDRVCAPALVARVREVIAELPSTQREVVTLRDVDGLSSGEVSAILGISSVQQRVQLHRARARIRSDLERLVLP